MLIQKQLIKQRKKNKNENPAHNKRTKYKVMFFLFSTLCLLMANYKSATVHTSRITPQKNTLTA